MERYRKKDMLQMVDTLLKANDATLKSALSNPQSVSEALIQCQESAIALGTYLETLGETYVRLVQILEEYCENIYQMSESLSDENVCRKLSKKIQKQLTALRNGIKYDMPEDKKEVVFLPYKASMWDSLESVWRAADADPDCNAYVIPIPYFDKNPDGSFREEHYEGDLYPKDVPITRYDEYDLEAQHPDIIYIHNPYDECNHVTSVHPYFYSKNLRNYTDKLVYIPYFILGEIEPDNQAAIDGMKHFCFTPGTIYADQVIVQSENMRRIYINEYLKAAKEMGLPGEHVDRKFLEKKFLGTGSPKIDKVLNTKKENLEIPEEWLRVIEKPDGSWKKVIFYNISVSALLHDEDKLLRKMESVFEIFKENKDEVALLWRPHPLIQATIESMRPLLWEEYKEIRDRYIEEGWGIYDDTADIDRAIILSDAYYGVWSSSVVHLYQKTGKPMMVQDIELLEPYQNIPGFVLSQKYNDKLWFSAGNYKGIFSLDILSGEMILEKELCSEKEDLNQRYLWGPMQVYDQYLVCPAVNAKYSLAFDIVQKKLVTIDYTKISNDLNIAMKYSGLFLDKNYVYLIPACEKGILCLDLKQKTSFPFINVSEKYRAFFGEEYYYLTTGNLYEFNEKIYLVLNDKPYLMCIDISKKNLDFIKIPRQSGKLLTLAGKEEFLYLISDEGTLIQWNIDQQRIEREQALIMDHAVLNSMVRSFFYDKYICFVSDRQNRCLRLNVDDFMASHGTFGEVWGVQGLESEELRFSCYDQQENIFFTAKGQLVIASLRTRESWYKKIKYPLKELKEYFTEERERQKGKEKVYYENATFGGLKEFLNWRKINESDRK